MEADRRYADLHLGLVDASVVALAESLGIRRLATPDVRHFAAVRLRDGRVSSISSFNPATRTCREVAYFWRVLT